MATVSTEKKVGGGQYWNGSVYFEVCELDRSGLEFLVW